jgi:tetrahydromethanopterin S-methyltransferase subunit A
MDSITCREFINAGWSTEAVDKLNQIVDLVNKIPFQNNEHRDQMVKELVKQYMTADPNERYVEEKNEEKKE